MANYYPYYQTNPYGMQQTSPVSIVWVSGELGARNYPIAPNTSILLMDSESSRFYIKSADILGVQTLRSYEYSEVTAGKPTETETVAESKAQNDYVSREEFDELKKTIDELMS